MKQAARILIRIAILAAAAALIIAITGLYAESMPPVPNRRPGEFFRRRNRPPDPQLRRLPSFAGEISLIGLIAFGGRKLLRLRLTD